MERCLPNPGHPDLLNRDPIKLLLRNRRRELSVINNNKKNIIDFIHKNVN